MQYSWLEKLAKEGRVRPDVKAAIYNDCSSIIQKTAEGRNSFMDLFTKNAGQDEALSQVIAEAKDFAQRNAISLSGLAYGGSVVFKGVKNFFGKEKEFKTILQNRKEITSDDQVGTYKDKAAARFDEIVKVAPRVAFNKDLAKRLVVDRLHSGFSSQDLQNLAGIQAAHSASVKSPMDHTDVDKSSKRYSGFLDKNDMSKKASVSAEKLGKIYADVICIMESRGVDKLASETGAFSKFFETLAIAAGVGATAGVGMGTVNYVNSKLNARNLREELQKSFNEAMKRSHPTDEPLHANKEKARQAFETLVHFAPNVARDPSAARGFMNSMIRYNLGTDPGVVKELSEIERNIASIKPMNPFVEGFSSGAKMMDMGKSVSKVTGDVAKQHLTGDWR